MPDKMRKLPVYLTSEEANRLFSVIQTPRERVLLQTCYFLGLRVGELITLKKTDINLKERVVTVQAENAKRKTERRIPIVEKFFPIISTYLVWEGHREILFDYSRQRVWQIVKTYAEKAGLEKNISPHTLRHSYASQVYQVTGNLKLVQDLLGHRDIGTTQIYLHLDDESKRRGLEGVF